LLGSGLTGKAARAKLSFGGFYAYSHWLDLISSSMSIMMTYKKTLEKTLPFRPSILNHILPLNNIPISLKVNHHSRNSVWLP
jgi:hypothetical protein